MLYPGIVAARVIDVRFATSGKVAKVSKTSGMFVKKNELLASLDRRIMQAELDKELADYEKTRADFEIFNTKSISETDIVNKYLKTEKQASLNSSVKQVEITKANLDMCDLFSPVDGMVLEDGNLAEGINITPAGATYKIIELNSYYLKCFIAVKDFAEFKSPREVKAYIDGVGEYQVRTTMPISDGKNIYIKIALPANQNLLIGLSGNIEI